MAAALPAASFLLFAYPYRFSFQSQQYEPRHNAALSSEQRRPPNLNHCAVNTKAESNRKCRALRICLKRFVMLFSTFLII
ncbi:hypothetical protein CJ424_23315 [Vibrio vulnificus]|nr:hypothetical protein [Vibrio vulnificus]MBH9767365.1 hypothetical protein [Vibrio vulnificus]MBH9775542.1 hypothetical protein [Vibrio vulnificus]MBH9783724.1 hypothetical protein [Vibrio vulnificus]MBH9826894.1 hypothetical protein [Vibrio vulnificus]